PASRRCSTAAASSHDRVEFSTAALTPASISPATWSRINAISGETTMQQPRQLIAQRLATPRGHQHEAIAAVHDMADDGFLRPAKSGQAEHGIQQGKRVGSKAGHPDRSIPDSGGRAYSLSDGFRAKTGRTG